MLSIQGCAWSKTDQTLFTIYTVSHAIDIMQTREIKDNEEYEEKNSILKEMSTDLAIVTMTGFWGATYIIMNKIPKYRTQIIVPLTIISVMCVTNNFIIGVKF